MAAEQQAPVDVAAEAPADAPACPDVKYFIEGSDNKKIEISELAVGQSKTLSDLIANLVAAADDKEKPSIPLSNISGEILQMIVTWCEKHKGEAIPVEDESVPKKVDTPDWDKEFLQIDNTVLFDLIVAANYLDIKQLMNYACKKVADMAKGKSPEELRVIYCIPTDEEDEKAEREAKEAAEKAAKEKADADAVAGQPSTSST